MTLILLLIAVPVVMHFKHAKAGMNGIHVDLVPSMDKKSEEESLSDKSKDDPFVLFPRTTGFLHAVAVLPVPQSITE